MNKLLTAAFGLAIALVVGSSDISAQVRPGLGGRGAENPSSVDAQVRRNRFPGGQRGVNRPPLGVPQIGRNRPPLNPNQMKKQQIQQRLMQAIGLRPEQRMRMQEIRRSHEDDVIASGRRLRLARQALDRAIMSEPYSEAEVRRATEALAAAQADKIRLDASVRSQVRGVLTPDQVQRFHQLQREMRRDLREQQQKDQDREMGPRGMGNLPELEEIDLTELLLSIS